MCRSGLSAPARPLQPRRGLLFRERHRQPDQLHVRHVQRAIKALVEGVAQLGELGKSGSLRHALEAGQLQVPEAREVPVIVRHKVFPTRGEHDRHGLQERPLDLLLALHTLEELRCFLSSRSTRFQRFQGQSRC